MRTIVVAGLPPVLRLSPDVAEAYERAMSTGKAAVDLPAEGGPAQLGGSLGRGLFGVLCVFCVFDFFLSRSPE